MPVNKRAARQLLRVREETTQIPARLGGGLLKEYVVQNGAGGTERYSLSYVNPALFAADHGRVLGYDNKHGFHHKHYFGSISEVQFVSFEETALRFEEEWREIAMNFVNRR